VPILNLHTELNSIFKHNMDGSFSTQSARKDILHMAVSDLHKLGFYNLSVKGLKPKHIDALVNKWRDDGKCAGTLKNRMAHLRWLTEKIGKPAIVARSNSHYGIERRRYVTNVSKATSLSAASLADVRDTHLQASLGLQASFGLRREEAIKFQPDYALNHDKLGYIRLKDTWCKGGRERYVPIINEEQERALAFAKDVSPQGSLIPKELRYVDQLRRYEAECRRLGLSKLHGLRHAYAQSRYKALTDFSCPAAAGPNSKQLDSTQKELDHAARLLISQELGHEREAITAIYLGR
jgi:hypothetical protein